MIENALPDDPTPTPLKATPLDAWHRAFGARMVPFAGYAMPVQYQGVLAEHLHCRAQAALFDVSHMGQATLSGAAAAAALERLVPGDMLGLKPGRQRYTLLTNEAGGILDDLMVANLGEERLFLVVNASRKEIDFTHIAANLPSGVQLRPHEDRALLALQGPAAAAVIGRIGAEAAELPFMGVAAVTLAGMSCLVSRSGYTGEDGFEISVPADNALAVAQRLLDEPEVVARRSRRARFAAAGGGALPLRQRHRRTDLADRGRSRLGDRQAPPRRLGLPRRRRDPRSARERHAAPPRRHPSRRPRARPRADRDRRRRRHRGRHDHLRRLLPHAERADRHGLRPQGPCRRRHRAAPDGARQAAARARRADAVRPPPLRPAETRSVPMAKPPSDIRYTKEHEWVRLDGDIATVGITDHAQEQLGDVVFVELPEIGRDVAADEACAVVESVKAASDVYAPLAGKVVETNQTIIDDPSIVNSDAEGEGWFFRIEIDDTDAFDALMDAAAYDEYVETLD